MPEHPKCGELYGKDDYDCFSQMLLTADKEPLKELSLETIKRLYIHAKWILSHKERIILMMKLCYEGKVTAYQARGICIWKGLARYLFEAAVILNQIDPEITHETYELFQDIYSALCTKDKGAKIYNFKDILLGYMHALIPFLRGRTGIKCDIESFEEMIYELGNSLHKPEIIDEFREFVKEMEKEMSENGEE